jgi:hypothetical protein
MAAIVAGLRRDDDATARAAGPKGAARRAS